MPFGKLIMPFGTLGCSGGVEELNKCAMRPLVDTTGWSAFGYSAEPGQLALLHCVCPCECILLFAVAVNVSNLRGTGGLYVCVGGAVTSPLVSVP